MLLTLLMPLVSLATVDLAKLPAAFCEDAETLLWGAQSCGDNEKLAAGAERCLAKLETLERNLGSDAMAIARAGIDSQLGQVHTGGTEYDFTDKAMTHLIAVSYLARQELEPFPAYLLAPPGYYEPEVTGSLDPDDYASRLACHGGMERRILDVQRKLAEKAARFEARRQEARAHVATLKRTGTSFDSRTAAARGVVNAALPSAAAARRPAQTGASSITGVEAERAKRLLPR